MAEEKRLYDEAGQRTGESRDRSEDAYADTQQELRSSRTQQRSAQTAYNLDRTSSYNSARDAVDAIDGIGTASTGAQGTLGRAGTAAQNEYSAGANDAIGARDRALATNALTGSAESILAQRAAQIGASPTIGAATETNILANEANAGARTANATQMLNRQAMGLAAGQGEGGALAMQQAVASAGAASGDMAAQSNLALGDQAAQSRYAAAMAQRDQDLAEAGYASDTRMGAAEAERQAQLAIAGQNATSLEGAAGLRATAGLNVGSAQAELGYQSALAQQAAKSQAAQIAAARTAQSGQANLQLSAQNANLASGNATTATGAESSDKDYQSGLLTAKYGAQKEREGERSLMSKVFTPFGILGS